jgi:hypothetical protein
MTELTRRNALAGATALGVVALAGCVSGNNGDDDPENQSESSGADDPDNSEAEAEPESGDSEEQDLELLDTTLSSAEAERGRGDMVSADIADGDVVVTGTLPTPTPHYEAVLSEATLDGRDLRLVVDAERTLEEEQAGTQPLGIIDYELTLNFSVEMDDLSTFDSFRVQHGGRSQETHTVETAGVTTGAVAGRDEEDGGQSNNVAKQGAVLASSIVTTNRGCTGGTRGNSPSRVDASDEVEFSQDGDTATVLGAVSASTPCHEAFLESVGYGAGTLRVVVGAESNLDRNEYCTECIADIEYEVTVELAEETEVSDVSMTHVQGRG